LSATSDLLKAHSTFIGPPYDHLSEHDNGLETARQSLSDTLMKMRKNQSDTKCEIAYGTLSNSDLSVLCKMGSRMAWPLFGFGTVATLIGRILRPANVDDQNPPCDVEEVINALNAINRPCRELNSLCQEGIEHILYSLRLGKYAKRSHLKLKKRKITSDNENIKDIGTDAFLLRFDSALDVLRRQSTTHLYYEKDAVPSQGIFFVLFLESLSLAVAQEIRSLILFVDYLRVEGTIARKRFIFPKIEIRQRPGDVPPQSYTRRVKRDPPIRL